MADIRFIFAGARMHGRKQNNNKRNNNIQK